VLADESGKPVARCRCGNPLSEPVSLEKQTKCFSCPPNYQPPPPCGDKCSRPEPDAPPVQDPGATVTTTPTKPGDPIAASKADLDKCRKDKGGLEQCKTEYEKARGQCAKSPLNPACDASVCFDGILGFDPGQDGCSSYLDHGDTLGACLKLETAAKQACLKTLDDLRKKCAANPTQAACKTDPKIKAFKLRRGCLLNPGRPECGALLGECAKDRQFGCEALENRINDLRQKCAQDPAGPLCKSLPPKTIAPTFNEEDKAGPGAGQPDQQPGAGDGQQPGAEGGTPDPGQAPPGEGSGGTPQPEGQTPAP